MKRTLAIASLVVLTASTAALAQSGPKPEQLIKWRQSVFQVLAWNGQRIRANVEGTTFNREDVVKAANSTAAIANSGIGALFAPGTETGKGWHGTAAKAELFAADSKVGTLAANFSQEATELARIAASGDQASVKAQFGKLNQTCKACHDEYKAKD